MSRKARVAAWVGGGLLAGILLGIVAVVVLTRTQFGMERVRGFALDALRNRVQGEVEIGRLTGPGLLGGAVVHDVAIRDTDGRPFVAVDSARVSYDWRSLLGGRIVLDGITLYRPHVVLEQLPGDTAWNYERIFEDTVPDTGPSARGLVMFEDVTLVDGTVLVRTPYEPGAGEEPGRTVVEDVPGGQVQVWRFDQLSGKLPRVIWESPIEEGRLIQVASLEGRGFLWRDPVLIRNLRGSLTLVDTVLSFDFPDVALTETRGAALGQVIMEEGSNNFDVRLDLPRLSFPDLRWLYPDLPEGGGSLVLRIQSQPAGGILWLAQDARITAPGTSVAGTVGFVTGDEPYFTRVDLRAAPLDLDLLASFLPDGLPVEGLAVGTVEVTGPLSALETTGDVRLSAPGGQDAGRVRWAGVVDSRAGHLGARSFRAELTGFDLAFLGNPGGLPGRVDGTVQARGTLRTGVRLEGNVRHGIGSAPVSTLLARGSVQREREVVTLDLLLEGRPLSLPGLAPAYPGLAGLEGDLTGTLTVRGPVRDLALAAELMTPGGPVAVGGRIVRSRDGPHLVGEGSVSGLRLDDLSSALPASTVSGRFAFDLVGTDPASIAGAVRAWVDGGQVLGLPLERGNLAVRLGNGLAEVDSIRLVTPAGRLWGAGSLGLTDTRRGTLTLEVASGDLSPLASVLYPDSIFDPLAPPPLAGTLAGSATLEGSLAELSVRGSAALAQLRGGPAAADSLQLALEASHLATDSARAHGSADAVGVRAGAHELRAAFATGDWDGDRLSVEANADGATGRVLHLTGDMIPGPRDRAVALRELVLGTGADAWTLRSGGTAVLEPGALRLDTLELAPVEGPGLLRGGGRLAWVEPEELPAGAPRSLDFRAEVRALPLADWLRLVASDASLSGSLDADLTVTGAAREPVVRGTVQVTDLRYQEAVVERLETSFDYGDRLLEGNVYASHQGRRLLVGRGSVPVDLRFTPLEERRLAEPLDFAARVDSLPAAMVLGLVDSFHEVSGWVDGDVRAAGTTLQPELGGALALRSGSAVFEPLGVRYEYVNGFFRVEPDGGVAVDLTLQGAGPLRGSRPAGQSLATVRGSVDLAEPTDPALDLTLTASQLLAASRRDVQAVVTGQVRVGGRYSRPEVSGGLRVDQGVLDVDELYRQYQVVQLESPLLFAAVDTSLVAVRQFRTTSPFLRNLRVDSLVVSVGSDAWLRGRDINVELTGDLNVALRPDTLRMSGTLTAQRGTYQLHYGMALARRFDVREGTVEFPGTPGIDPNLAMTAAYRVRRSGDEPLDIQAVVGGSLQAPRVRLTSDADPPISESDLASYLFFGVPTYALRGYASPGGTADGRPGLGSQLLAPTAYGLFSSGLQSLSQSLGFFDYVGLTAAEAAPGGDILANTQLEIGFYVTPEVFVSYEQRLASREPGVRLEWRVNPAFTAEVFAEDRFARAAGSFGLGQTIAPRRVYGFLLFREWGY